jgi:hypothetical protein
VEADLEAQGLRDAVEAQARARVKHDLAAFASYMTPQAIVQLGRQPAVPRRSRSFEVVSVSEDGADGMAEVRFSGGGAYVLRTRWKQIDGRWKAVEAEIPAASIRVPWWRRIVGGGRPGPSPERRDLS